MPNSQQVVIYKAAPVAVRPLAVPQLPFPRFLVPFLNRLLGLDILAIIQLTAIHFDEKSFYEKYDRASVEAMSERGGW